MRTVPAVLVLGLIAVGLLPGCGGGSSSPTPAPTPTPSPTPTPPATYTVRGQVSEPAPFSANKIEGARVEFIDGTNAGKGATTDASGNYTITSVNPGGFTMRASATGYNPIEWGVTVTGDLTRNFELPPSAPRRRFGPGQYRVNTDVAPGRYYADPASGCYWERQRGLGGTTSDIIANDFVSFDAQQVVVDILSSDVAFETDADCGTWFDTPRHGSQATIPPGVWLVGPQVAPGTYTAAVQSGCYWERLRDFTGSLNGIIANDFVSSAGARFITISGTDVGFATDDDCGTWTRAGSLTEQAYGVRASGAQTGFEIERLREMNRRQKGPWPAGPR